MSVRLPVELWFERPFDALVSAARRWPERQFLCVLPETALAYGCVARSFTYSESLAEVAILRAAFAAANVGAGQRIGLMLENRPAFFFSWLALNALGASAVPLNVDWRGAELEYIIDHSELALAVVRDDRRSRVAEAARAASRPVPVVTEAELREGMTAALAGVAAPGTDSVPACRTECALLYTSGTTGRPKGCVLSNEYFVWAGQWYASVGGLCEVRTAAERMLTPLPSSHMNAMACSTLCMLLSGGTLIPLDRFHPRTWWSSVRDSRATIVHYLGVMPAMLLAAPASAEERDHLVRFGFGAGVNPSHHAVFEQRFGFPLLEAWAMTETGAGAIMIANREPRQVGSACFGKAEAAVDFGICAENGSPVEPGLPGELLVRAAGPEPRFGFFERYLKDEIATAAAWEGGWFHTGDVVRMDADGQLHFVDRLKNVIRRSGENISAVEVEGALSQHPLIAAIGVAGVPDPVRGEEVFACIVPSRSLAAAELAEAAHDIVRFGLARLAYFKPPGFVHFCAALPRTATEKIQRRELQRLAVEALARASVVDTRSLKRREPGVRE